MAKRFAFIFFISLGIAFAGVVIFSLILFLAPGLSLFGVKYIATGTHIVSESTVISEKMPGKNFSGSIRVEVDDVPIQVIFSQGSSFDLEYYDNYNGLTNSNFDDPEINYSKDPDGTAVIKIKSFKRFIFENNNSVRYLKLILPSTVVGSTKEGELNLTIVSKTSSVSFSDQVEDNYDPYFNKIDIETSGNVSTSTCVKANVYSLKTINTIQISSDSTKSINAKNYILNSTGGRIVVDRDVEEDITATTKDSRIQILSCRNFTANSGFGDIYCSKSDESIVVRGKVNITSTAGLVQLGSILGTSESSTISTTTGNIEIKKINDAKITSTRGFIKVVSGKNLEVSSSSGAITVEEATESVKATSKRGKIVLGGEETVLNNPTAENIFGDIYIYSASGVVNAQTTKADMVLNNRNSTKIKLKVGGQLTATKLTGAVDIEVDEGATIDFSEFTSKSTIIGKSGSPIKVEMLNNDLSTFSYIFHANNAALYEYNDLDVENHYQIDNSTDLTSSPENVGKPLLTIKNEGSLVVYIKRTV